MPKLTCMLALMPILALALIPLPAEANKIETYTYIRLVLPVSVQSGDVLLPHLYDFFFDGVDDSVLINTTVLGQTRGSTINLFFRPETIPSTTTAKTLFLHGRRYDLGGFEVYVQGQYNTFRVWYRGLGGEWSSPDTGINTVLPGRWYLGSVVYNSSHILLFLNSTLLRVSSFNGTVGNRPTSRVAIEPSYADSAFHGHVSYLILHDRAMSSNEISDIYNRNLVNSTGLRLFLDPTWFNGTHFIDISSYGNHGVGFGVQRVLANRSWIWVVRGNYSDRLVRLRFFPSSTIVRFANGDTLDLSSYTANGAGLVEYIEIDRTDIQDILIPDTRSVLYIGYPENPGTVYANMDTSFGVTVVHASNISLVSTVRMRVADVVFTWNREAGFIKEADPRNVARLNTISSYVIIHNETCMSIYFVFRLDWAFDLDQGHRWHNITFEAYSDDSRYALVHVRDAFMFVDTVTPVNITLPTKTYAGVFIEIAGNLVYTGTNIPITDYYGVKICVENFNKTACYDPLIEDALTGRFNVKHYVDAIGTHIIRVYAVTADGEIGYNNNADFTVEQEPIAGNTTTPVHTPVHSIDVGDIGRGVNTLVASLLPIVLMIAILVRVVKFLFKLLR